MKKQLSVEQQLANLRPTQGFAAQMHKLFLGGAAFGVIAAVLLWHPLPLMFSIFFAVIGLADRKAGPNIAAALSAYESGAGSHGAVSIAISFWDMDNHYHATLHEEGHPDWKYEFVPQGWSPAAGTYPARIWRSDAHKSPILAVVAEGLMIPRNAPTQVPPQDVGTNEE